MSVSKAITTRFSGLTPLSLLWVACLLFSGVASANQPPDSIAPVEYSGLEPGEFFFLSLPVATDPDPSDNYGSNLTYVFDSCAAPAP